MPEFSSLEKAGLVQTTKTINFLETDENKKAREDFCYIVNKSGMSYYLRLGRICVTTVGSEAIADCICLAGDAKKGVATLPKSEMVATEAGKVALVVYDKDAVSGIYVFDYSEIQKGGLFSRFKYDKKDDEYKIKLAGIEKCGNNKFGVVFTKYINNN